MTNWILGVGASHNGGAALLRDGELVVAIQEERLTRLKRSRVRPAFDVLAIQYCLDAAGISVADLDVVGVARDEPIALPDSDLSRNPLLADRPDLRVTYINHHRAHAAAAAFQSGLEDAAVLVIDGLGSPIEDCDPQEQALAGRDGWETMSVYHLSGGQMIPLRKDVARDRQWISIGESGMPRFAGIGGMYSAVSVQIFGQYLEAGKVMGLAPYGDATMDPDAFYSVEGPEIRFSDTVPQRFRHDDRWPRRRDEYQDLAASVQGAIEGAILWAARQAHELTGSRRLAYAGGVALNCLANERIIRDLDFDDVFIMPAAEDSGTSIGAAVAAAMDADLPLARKRLRRDSPGRSYGQRVAAAALERFPAELAVQRGDAVPLAVEALLAGACVGWYEGGAELGPRALGRRSILADARRASMWEELNARKGREAFRPLAPLVLESHVHQWFDVRDDSASPFMLRVFEVLADAQPRIPAVVHVDGSARAQTVAREDHPQLHRLLEAFHRETGVPVLINTSFNAAGEPIVETPEDALWCAHHLRLDYLVLEGMMVKVPHVLPPSIELVPAEHEVRRQAGHRKAWGLEVEVETAWGPTRHWIDANELELFQLLCREGAVSLSRLAGNGAVEQLRRRRLLRMVASSPAETRRHAAVRSASSLRPQR